MNETFEQRLAKVLCARLEDCAELVSSERLSGGANQETYRLVVRGAGGERQLALRRAAAGSDDAGSELNIGLATEARLFALVSAAGVPAPAVHYVLRSEDGLGPGFVMAWLEGETLGHRIAGAPEFAAVRPRLARRCGEILARIHAIDIEAHALTAVLPSVTPREEVEQTWSRYRALDTAQPMIDYTARWLLDHLPDDPPMTLVHNDFRNGNLMVDDTGVIAVLDWEIAHIGDPVRDLGWLCTHSWRFGHDELAVGGFGHLDDLLAGYAAGGGAAVEPGHLRFWQVFGSFWWAVGCLMMAKQFRDGPDRSVERPAIGRRSSECQADCVNMLIPGPVALVAATAEPDSALPRGEELLDSVAEFLREDAAAATRGRTRFFTRVAANSLAIVKRELALGPVHREAERARLMALLGATGDLDALRWRLVHGLRDGSIALGEPDLAAHLRASVINQLAIDQPAYPALATATAYS